MNVNQTIVSDFIHKRPFAAAQTLERLSSEEVAVFLQTVSSEKSLKLLSLMNAKKAAACFLLLPSQKTTEILENGEPQFIASLLNLIETPLHKEYLLKVSKDKKLIIKLKMQHTTNSVGAFMETVISVNKEMTVSEAVQIAKINTQKEEFYLYVVDLEGVFKGIVRLKELLLADESDTLEDLMITKISKILPDIQVKSIVNHPAWLKYRHIPVVDASSKLLGALSYKATRELQEDSKDSSTNEITETGNALGELYRIGLTGLLKSLGK